MKQRKIDDDQWRAGNLAAARKLIETPCLVIENVETVDLEKLPFP